MKFLANQKLATRISIITTIITLTGMLLLWLIVSSIIATIVKNDITNQITDAVESRAAIINDYVASAEEYMTAFLAKCHRHNHPFRRIPENLPKHHSGKPAADQSGDYEIAGHREHDSFHVLSDF